MRQFELKNSPLKLDFLEGDPLKLSEEFKFYHNKLKFRKEINRLQYLFQKYFKSPLQATGIRDSYLNEKFTESFFILIFSTYDIIRKMDDLMKNYLDIIIKRGCFFIESNSNYIILLSKDMEGLTAGIYTMEEILTQILDNYFQKKEFDTHIKIYPFKLYNCSKL